MTPNAHQIKGSDGVPLSDHKLMSTILQSLKKKRP